MRLKGKVGLVTGAASGMGRSTAIRFAEEGATVVVTDVDAVDGPTIAEEISSKGGRAIFMTLDVTIERNWSTVIDYAVRHFGKIDILVNNAGLSGGIGTGPLDVDAWDRLMTVNAKSAFLGIKHVIPVMQANGGGSIVNISSISGLVGQKAIHVGYNASKSAIKTLSKVIAVQHGQDNIRCNSIHPGIMPPMKSAKRTADPAWRQSLIQAIPLGRAGEAVDVANAVVFLASDEASYVTGTELIVDGGFTAQ